MTIKQKRAYWKRRLEREESEQMRHEPVSATQPKGMVLLAHREITVGAMKYPRGSIVPPEALNNLQALLDGRFLVWAVKPHNAPQPRELPPAPPPPTRPAVIELVLKSDDPVENWFASKKHMTAKCGGDAVMASDLLRSIPGGAQLFKDATRVACAAEARRRKVVSVSPSDLNPRL
jgi:hypothetical protein